MRLREIGKSKSSKNKVAPPPPQKALNTTNNTKSSPVEKGCASITNRSMTQTALVMRDLPTLRDAAPNRREALFLQKLLICRAVFYFDGEQTPHNQSEAIRRQKDVKRQTLLELVDYVNTPAGQKIFTEAVMPDLMAMVSANVCRALPPATDDFDPEEDEPVLEPAWPHLQVAYEFFLRFIVSSEVNAKSARKVHQL